jgi:hypothetical protein
VGELVEAAQRAEVVVKACAKTNVSEIRVPPE